jgi:hypothetical protein
MSLRSLRLELTFAVPKLHCFVQFFLQISDNLTSIWFYISKRISPPFSVRLQPACAFLRILQTISKCVIKTYSFISSHYMLWLHVAIIRQKHKQIITKTYCGIWSHYRQQTTYNNGSTVESSVFYVGHSKAIWLDWPSSVQLVRAVQLSTVQKVSWWAQWVSQKTAAIQLLWAVAVRSWYLEVWG